MRKGIVRSSWTLVLMIFLVTSSSAFKYAGVVKRVSPSSIILSKNIVVAMLNPENRKNIKINIIKKAVQQTTTEAQAGQMDTNGNTAAAPNQTQSQTQPQAPAKQTSAKAEWKNFAQLASPVKGDEIAIIKTNIGNIKIKLLSEYAPKTVALFKERVNNGYYNGTDFYRVIPNSLIQGGQQSQSNTITTGDLDTFNPEVRNFRGAVSLVYSDTGNPQDQFSIVGADATNIVKDALDYMVNSGEVQFPKYVINQYKKTGGAPWSDFHNVVFGQVIKGKQGLDVVDQISQIGVDENNKPKKEVKIIKITIVVN